jgi:hypothetical protein
MQARQVTCQYPSMSTCPQLFRIPSLGGELSVDRYPAKTVAKLPYDSRSVWPVGDTDFIPLRANK